MRRSIRKFLELLLNFISSCIKNRFLIVLAMFTDQRTGTRNLRNIVHILVLQITRQFIEHHYWKMFSKRSKTITMSQKFYASTLHVLSLSIISQ